MPTKRSNAKPRVNFKKNCLREKIENLGMSCNSLWNSTFPVYIGGQKVIFCVIKIYQNPTGTGLSREK